jgi:hypothetical protein
MTARRGIIASLGLAGLALAGPAYAEPTAIVEAVQGRPAEVQPLDYLAAGRALHLGAGEVLVIDYLRSCRRETISGGSVTIGKNKSHVTGGEVRRQTIDCDGNEVPPVLDEAAAAAKPQLIPPVRPEGQPHETGLKHTIYSTSPLIDLGAPGELTVMPVDPPGPPITSKLAAADLLHGRFYDFAAAGRRLAPGGLYLASAHGRELLFWVDPLAQEGAGPPAGRLLRF